MTIHTAQLYKEMNSGDVEARIVLADILEENGDLAKANDHRARAVLFNQINNDILPNITRRNKVDKLTANETAQMADWAKRWIDIGLCTEPADRSLFEVAATACYRRSGLEPPRFAWYESPIVAVMAGAIWSSLGNPQANNQVFNQVENQVENQVRNQVSSQVYNQVYNQVNNQVNSNEHKFSPEWDKAIKSNWVRYLGGQFWVGGYGWSNAYIMYMLDVLGLDIGKELELGARAYAACAMSACWWYPTQSVCFVSERPHELIKNTDGSLKRVAWDGWKIIL